ncbi:lactonase family protein [Legionella maioricensis]|uniref:YncE family protein n=1 Tax=Legionella maioricensis TaxID=2896528 RepID=A0A9X2CYA6_9GAMM|nr:YncE family protein [Legionella maioricensis]MCL9683023.1 YncE family protein [Legionella maioricensis]MCL9686371.1 YncE family protein [Legionella maioricensis]
MNKRIKSLCTWSAGTITLLTATFLNAAMLPVFDIEPASPTTMLLPVNSSEIVQYKVTNNTARQRVLTMQPISGVNQITGEAGVCPSPFTLDPKTSCLLTLQINGNQIPPRITDGPTVCKTQGPGNNTPDPFLCSKPEANERLSVTLIPAIPAQHAYITNWDQNSISLCDVSTLDGTFSNCIITASGALFANPEAITTLNLDANNTVFYVANINALNMAVSTVVLCQVNNGTGALSGCAITGSGFNGADGIAINPAGTLAYVSNAGADNVSLCQVDSITGALGNCGPTGNGFHIPSDMTLNPLGTIAYVSDLANYVSICPVDATTGLLSCHNRVGGFSQPEGITLHPSGQFAYLTNNGSNNISVCKVDVITSNLHSCSITGGRFDGFGNLAFNNLGSRAYVPIADTGRVSVCFVNQNNGTLSLCKDSHGTFDSPSGVLLR